MSSRLSPNTKAILLLTAPLIAGRNEKSPDLLSLDKYKELARTLRARGREPADLLTSEPGELLKERDLLSPLKRRPDQPDPDALDRLSRLLGRGVLLGLASERWESRGIWVTSHADTEYPRRLKERLGKDAPPVLYGCGDASILDSGGLAVVGSRNAADGLLEYAREVGRLAAQASLTLVSGGARGIDQAAMRGALDAGGRVAGVLSGDLERVAQRREYIKPLQDRQLVLVSPFDPCARFSVGNAMGRNKLIYALADAALVVACEPKQGGTWAGATEQLGKRRFVPLFVRSVGETGKGLEELLKEGALPWPEPRTATELRDAIQEGARRHETQRRQVTQQRPLPESTGVSEELASENGNAWAGRAQRDEVAAARSPADELFAKVAELVASMAMEKPRSAKEVADELRVSKAQAGEWLRRLVAEGVLVRDPRTRRYLPQPRLIHGSGEGGGGGQPGGRA